MNASMHRLCVYSGFAFIGVFLLGFWIVAGFIPPPSPGDNAHEVAQLYREDKNQIRAGMIISIFAAVLIAPWVAAVTVHMRRIEGPHCFLAYIQLGMGMLLVLEFIYLVMFFQVATFRTHRSDESIQTLNDMGWIPFAGLTTTGVLQPIVIGIAILADRSTPSVFPRWVGYFNLWMAVCVAPGSFNVYFKDGPLAWNGVVAWYIPLTCFCLWVVVMAVVMLRLRLPQESTTPESSSPEGLRVDVDRLVAEMAEVRGTLGQSTPRG